MRNLNLALVLLVLAFACLLLPPPSPAATDVQIEQGFGFLDVTTQSIDISASAATLIGTVPNGTKNVYLTAFYADVLVGHSSDLATGSVWCAAWKIASGTTIKIDGIMTTKPNIWVIPNVGTATVKIGAWGTN